VSRGRKNAAKSVDDAAINRARELAAFCLAFRSWVPNEILEERRRDERKRAEIMCEAVKHWPSEVIRVAEGQARHLLGLRSDSDEGCGPLFMLAADLIERGEVLSGS
jgi:hypothetical protein